MDKSARSRDLIDLAFMMCSWADEDMSKGLKLAQAAYGASVLDILKSTVDLFADEGYRKQCVAELEVRGKRKLDSGLRKLTTLLKT